MAAQADLIDPVDSLAVAPPPVGRRLSARRLQEALATAAEALLAGTLENPEDVERRMEATIELEERDPELLLRAFVNELVFLREARGWLLHPGEIRIDREGEDLRLHARLEGECLDPERHHRAPVPAAARSALDETTARSSGASAVSSRAARGREGAGAQRRPE